MSYFKYATSSDTNEIIEELYKLLTSANNFKGRVFGGFVRDVVVPRENDPNCTVDFKDVDIFFTKLEDAKAFIEAHKDTLVETLFGSNFKDDGSIKVQYPDSFSVLKFYYKPDLYTIANIDVVVANRLGTLTVDDFDVNCLAVSFVDNKPVYKSGRRDLTVEQLKTSILNKQARMFKGYQEKLDPSRYASEGFSREAHNRRIERAFTNKGWTITKE